MGACQNSIEVFCFVHSTEGGSDQLDEIRMRDLPALGGVHVGESFLIHAAVVWVVAGMAARTLLEVCR